MAINPTYRDRVKYTLQHKDYGSQVITEPIGWETDEKEYARNEKYHGIFAKFSNNLKFVGDGADFIKLIRSIYGINADIRLIREEAHPHTDVWMRSYDGYLDLSTYETEDRQVSVKFDASGLEKMLSTRESEKVEIERLDTMDGMPLPALDTKTVRLEGRRIFLKSIFSQDDVEDSQQIYIWQNSGKTKGMTWSVPIKKTVSSHEQAESTLVGHVKYNDAFPDRIMGGTPGFVFFLSSDKERELNIKLDMSFNVNNISTNDLSHWKVWFRLAHYKDGNKLEYKDNYDLFTATSSAGFANRTINLSFDQTLILEKGDSLGLVVDAYIDVKPLHDGSLAFKMSNILANMTIEENSFYEPSTSKVILAHELAERLVNIITNNVNAVYSEALGRTDLGYESDGVDTGALVGFSHGHWIRGFDKLPLEEDNKYKAFSTTFKDFIENETVTWNLGLGIERIGYKERVRIEKQEYFYNNNVTIRLPNQVKKVKRKEADKLYYSGLEFGYTKGGEYEEAMGLDEYNVKSTFTTIINRVKNVYDQVSKYRADSYGMEFARRKQKVDFATQDTSYDTDIFNIDMKRFFGDVFKQRIWQDDFEQEPTGTFSPETATNLRLSPFNMLLRHGWVIASGLTKYLNDYVRYGSSEANSKLTTKLIGHELHAENGKIQNAKLGRPRFVNEWIEFEHAVDFDIINQVEGHSTIMGKKIPNFYGLVEFINEDNEIEKGYLFNLKPQDEGKWKLLKSNR